MELLKVIVFQGPVTNNDISTLSFDEFKCK